MNKNLEELSSSLQTGFINELVPSSKEFRPEILLNNQLTGSKVLTTILRQLNRCDEFWFSVAFLRMSGFACLVNTLQELEEKIRNLNRGGMLSGGGIADDIYELI